MTHLCGHEKVGTWNGLGTTKEEMKRDIGAVVKVKMEGNRPGGRLMLRWKDTVRRDMEAWKSGRNGKLTERKGKVSARPSTPHTETKGE